MRTIVSALSWKKPWPPGNIASINVIQIVFNNLCVTAVKNDFSLFPLWTPTKHNPYNYETLIILHNTVDRGEPIAAPALLNT